MKRKKFPVGTIIYTHLGNRYIVIRHIIGLENETRIVLRNLDNKDINNEHDERLELWQTPEMEKYLSFYCEP